MTVSKEPSQPNRPNESIMHWFLDSSVSGEFHVPTPQPTLPAPLIIAIGDVEDILAIAQRYFETLHIAMPFISRIRFFGSLPMLPSEFPLDTACLTLCLRLLMSEPTQPYSHLDIQELYQIAKEQLLNIEANGIITIKALQSALLLGIYEVGHGIYPSAYFTVGLCSRIGLALGLEHDITIFENTPHRWVEQEERNRAWWMVLILDKYGSHLAYTVDADLLDIFVLAVRICHPAYRNLPKVPFYRLKTDNGIVVLVLADGCKACN